MANEIAVCDQCHAMIHAGLLEVSGSPYTGLTWSPRPVSAAAKLRNASAVCARAREIGALFAPAQSARSRHVDTSSPADELAEISEVAETTVSRRGDPPAGWRELAGGQVSRRGDPDDRVRELTEALVSLGFSRSDGRRLVEAAFEALAGQAQGDELILREALRNR